jgi:hypothetical protein
MKYLINKETKEHFIFGADAPLPMPIKNWAVLEADSEGWIPHTGDVCPLPDDVKCEVKNEAGVQWDGLSPVGRVLISYNFYWPAVSAYRPILTEPEKVQETEELRLLECSEIGTIKIQDTASTFNLLDRLKWTHEHAQQIPDLEKELREVLGSMGYTLGKLSPFVETESQGVDAAFKDALIYGTSVMRGGKHIPIQDFYVAPEAAQENNK